ncbi:hypothetical protein WMY93_014159 [Mugilogobius chulae]|uniref:PA domain-containing protein n=1 Tax=Mugilogobius chulae TaxID=88201 RepID=A0AAW0P0B1_9GOBI
MAPGSLVAACRTLALSTWLLSFCFVHLLCLDFTVAEREEWYTAFVNITYTDPATGEWRTEKTECGRYGEHSPKRDARGVLVLPASDRLGCDPGARFQVQTQTGPWIALIAKGNCSYRDKIRHAAAQNASAVVIYNVGSANANDTITMPHPALQIRQRADRNQVTTATHTTTHHTHDKHTATHHKHATTHRFIVLVIISLAWLVFYYIQRFRYANARTGTSAAWGDAAKKAISKLQVRTIRKGDQETEPDFDNCAVCIESYKANDVVRVLPAVKRRLPGGPAPGLRLALGGVGGVAGVAGVGGALEALGGSSDGTVSEGGSSVALEPGVRRLELPQDFHQDYHQDYHHDDESRASPVTASTDTRTAELEPAAGSSSMASLVIAVENQPV